MQTTPLALVLTNANDHIVFGNIAARQLFRAGRKIEGIRFGDLLENAPQPLRDAVDGGVDTLFTVSEGTEAEIFHVSNRPFTLNSQPHRLLLFKQLTREMAAQEVAIWKKVIRVIAHELNNSLAPITSLAHSGRELAHAAGHRAAHARVLDHRGARLAPRDFHRRLRALRQAAAAAPGRGALGPAARGTQGQPVVPRGAAAARDGRHGWTGRRSSRC